MNILIVNEYFHNLARPPFHHIAVHLKGRIAFILGIFVYNQIIEYAFLCI